MAPILDIGSQFRSVKTGGISIPFSSGNVSSVELPRSLFKKRLMLRLSGTVSVTAAGSAVVAESPLRLIKRVEIVGDGVKTLVNLSGAGLFRLAHVLEGKQPELTGPASAAVQANTAVSALIPINFEAVRFRKPADSYLDPRGFESLQLRITWGSVADIIVGGTATVNAGTAIDVQDYQTASGQDDIAFRRLISSKELAVTATTSALENNVSRNGLLAGVLIYADIDGAPSDTLINNVSLRSDNMNLHCDRLNWLTLRKVNDVRYNIDSATFGAGIPGYAFIDLTEDAMLSSCLNTYNLNTLQFIYDVTKTGTNAFIREHYVFYEPINVG